MAQASVPVDLRNPGQVFACLGLMEATEILTGPCEGRFAYEDGRTDARFELAVPGESNPVETVLQFLATCQVVALVPNGMRPPDKKWNVHTEPLQRSFSPIAFRRSRAVDESSSATLPVRLRNGISEIPVEYWIDTRPINVDNVKFWGGSQGKPGAAIATELIAAISTLFRRERALAVERPFDCWSEMSGSFRLDWRRDYTAIDAGFSLNKHKTTMTAVGYPFVELLGAVGLQHARPVRAIPRDPLNYRYHVPSSALPTVLMRVAIGTPELGFLNRSFCMRLDWANQEGQARCIINAEEESLMTSIQL
jgi:CRISPR-associated protein Csx14